MAIAFDAAVNPSYANATTHTVGLTVGSGSDRILFLGLWYNDTSGAPTSVQYAGVSMTQLGSNLNPTSVEKVSLWYLYAPTTGANNMVVTFSGSVEAMVSGVSYSGVSQSGFADASSTGVGISTNTTGTVTTVADNCWTHMFVRTTGDGISSAGSGTVRRTNVNGRTQSYDGNGAHTPAGSYSLNATHTNQPRAYIIVSFAPPGAASGPANLKSYNTNVAANIKSINTNLIANVKSLNTNV